MIVLLLIVAAATLVVVAGMNYVTSRATLSTIESQIHDNIHSKGSDLVASQALALRDLVDDNAFGDVARLVDRTLEKDDELVYGIFLGADLKPWRYTARTASEGYRIPQNWRELGIDAATLKQPGILVTSKTFGGQTVFEFATTVRDDKGEFLGSVRYAISDRTLQRALARARAMVRRALITAVAMLLLMSAGTTLLGLLLARRAAARVTRPISELTKAAGALAGGQRDVRVAIDSGDEIEQLGNAFNHMATELQDYYARLEEMNRGLEDKVAERTRELGDRNRDMRLVLDNVEQGFLTLSPDGKLAHEHSAIVDKWFGTYEARASYVDFIALIDPSYAEYFALGYDALLDNMLPRELCIQQLPTSINHKDREYRCSYLPLGPEEQFGGMLIVIDDVTAELRAAQYEAERREILAMFEGLTRDRPGFLAFVEESNEQVTGLATADLATQKRLLHTLKGNGNLMGLRVVAEICHTIEDEICETGDRISEVSLAKVTRHWQEIMKTLGVFLGERGKDVVEVREHEIDRLSDEIRTAAPAAQLLDRIASWRLEAAERPLSRLASHARALASRMGKGDLSVVIEGGDLRLAPDAWGGLWSALVHVVRNAVDHGIESTAVRQSAGKPARPSLRLGVRVEAQDLVIEFEDDGAGIDWRGIGKAAAQRGLPVETEADLVRAMFTDEVTTRSEVTSLSGRGVGLGAVRHEVEQLGGILSVQSRAGGGTCFRFTFPLPGVGPRFGVEPPASSATPATPAAQAVA
jgi:two-component system chemotaxis sensor kinase CheA